MEVVILYVSPVVVVETEPIHAQTREYYPQDILPGPRLPNALCTRLATGEQQRLRGRTDTEPGRHSAHSSGTAPADHTPAACSG
eukprot:scaffold4518_cov410-Prasinococcus_capsulatus_cf.AAC.2